MCIHFRVQDPAHANQDRTKAIQKTQSGPNVPFLMPFEGKLPVFKNRNISKTKQKKKKETVQRTWIRNSSAPAAPGEIRFIPFDGGLSALPSCEDDPESPTPLQYSRGQEPDAGLSTCVERVWMQRRAGGCAGGVWRGQARGGRAGRELRPCSWTGDGVGTAEKASWGLAVECGQCCTKASVRGRTWWNGARGSGGIQTRKHASLFFVCLSKENCNWNCLIFKRVIRDGMASWGLCSPGGVRRETLWAAALRHCLALGQAGSGVPSSRERCAFVRKKYTSPCGPPPFLYNNYITYAFIHYELISASQRYMTKETISGRMWP